ncbi:hypothetical protein BC834DRAFT_19207 [Gloeopeniophorella convolvens]|nr:hypothetical protein BC834DRAFT_19207 [Gloeopeniophorella convolvens]
MIAVTPFTRPQCHARIRLSDMITPTHDRLGFCKSWLCLRWPWRAPQSLLAPLCCASSTKALCCAATRHGMEFIVHALIGCSSRARDEGTEGKQPEAARSPSSATRHKWDQTWLPRSGASGSALPTRALASWPQTSSDTSRARGLTRALGCAASLYSCSVPVTRYH